MRTKAITVSPEAAPPHHGPRQTGWSVTAAATGLVKPSGVSPRPTKRAGIGGGGGGSLSMPSGRSPSSKAIWPSQTT